MPGKVLPFVSKENISTSYVSVTKYIVHKYSAQMSYIPVTTELNLRLNNKPLHLPVDKDHGLLVTTLKSAFGQSAIGLKGNMHHKHDVSLKDAFYIYILLLDFFFENFES